jgi:SAM-dependent methyltransferase
LPDGTSPPRSVLAWRFPRLYDLYFRLSPVAPRLRRREIEAVFRAVGAVAQPTDRVIEFGSGPGTYTRLLAPRVAEVVAYDREPRMVARLTDTLRRDGIGNVTPRVGLMPAAIVVDEPADGLLAAGVMDYADDLAVWLATCRDAVRPGGWIVATVPFDRGGPRAASPAEGWLAGRVYPRTETEVHDAVAATGVELVTLEQVDYGGRTYTLVARLAVPG